jgi:CheY-like chemotaxis protein
VLATGATVHTAEEYRASDGTWIAIEMTASPVLEDGRLTGAVVAFRDVRKRREVERMKDEFISVVSHELRTPLTSIRGSLGLVSSGSLGELSPKAARMIDVAAESTDRSPAHQRHPRRRTDRVRHHADGTHPRRRRRPDPGRHAGAAAHGAAAGVHLISHAEEAEVEADADRIVQTITNLVSNAVKFSTRGDAVVVRAAVDASDVVVSVADQGRGVPADMLEAIFGRFQQVDSSDARLRGGTGLGLAISKGIVEKHGGRIWVDSTVGVGSVFRFTLPVVRRPRSTDRLDAAPAVLICDDDDDMRDVVTAQLVDAGFRTVTTADATDAFRRAVEERPGGRGPRPQHAAADGRDAFRNLLLHPETRDVPVVVLSIQPAGGRARDRGPRRGVGHQARRPGDADPRRQRRGAAATAAGRARGRGRPAARRRLRHLARGARPLVSSAASARARR